MNLPTCLEMVQRVQEECGDIPVTSLNPGTRRSKIALEGLNDACVAIWGAARWSWQRYDLNLTLVAGTSEYTLPSDFDRLAEPPRLSAAGNFLTMIEMTPEEWVQYQLGVPTTTGTPSRFKIENTKIVFGPAPSTDFLTTYPTIMYTYFKEHPARKTINSGADAWDVPGTFYEEMIDFGKAKLKQYLEFPDWQADLQAFEKGLKTQQNNVRQGRKPAVMRPMFSAVPNRW